MPSFRNDVSRACAALSAMPWKLEGVLRAHHGQRLLYRLIRRSSELLPRTINVVEGTAFTSRVRDSFVSYSIAFELSVAPRRRLGGEGAFCGRPHLLDSSSDSKAFLHRADLSL